MSRFRNYCYTLNNYTVGDSASLSDIEAVYHVWGYERSASGTPHVQGFIQFETPKALTAVKKIIPRSKWEVMKGSLEQASDYCKKDGDYVEKGEIKKQGQRNDLKHATANEEATAHKRSIRNESHYKSENNPRKQP